MNSAAYFNEIAEDWNKIRKEYFKDELRNKVISTIDIEGKVCADLGCGTGFISLELSKKAEIVFSIDNSTNMLHELKKSTFNKGIKNVYPMKGDMYDLPLYDESVDVVFINMALHHIEHIERAIKEMHRILNKKGTIIISDVEEHNGNWAREEMHDVWLGFSHKQIKNAIEKAGLKEVKVESSGLKCTGYSSKGEFTETGIFIAQGKKY